MNKPKENAIIILSIELNRLRRDYPGLVTPETLEYLLKYITRFELILAEADSHAVAKFHKALTGKKGTE